MSKVSDKDSINNDIVLIRIVNYMKSNLNIDTLTELNDKINCLNNFCKGDGCGLTSGTLIDMFITKFLIKKLSEFNELHDNEADCTICNERLSLKKIKGKSTIALNWSKNPTEDKKEKFTDNMMIINLKTCKWWKQKQSSKITNKIDFTMTIPAGIYIVDKYYCKNKVILTTNNKTNSLIDSKCLYMMLYDSINRNMFMELPKESKKYTFDICLSFIE